MNRIERYRPLEAPAPLAVSARNRADYLHIANHAARGTRDFQLYAINSRDSRESSCDGNM